MRHGGMIEIREIEGRRNEERGGIMGEGVGYVKDEKKIKGQKRSENERK